MVHVLPVVPADGRMRRAIHPHVHQHRRQIQQAHVRGHRNGVVVEELVIQHIQRALAIQLHDHVVVRQRDLMQAAQGLQRLRHAHLQQHVVTEGHPGQGAILKYSVTHEGGQGMLLGTLGQAAKDEAAAHQTGHLVQLCGQVTASRIAVHQRRPPGRGHVGQRLRQRILRRKEASTSFREDSHHRADGGFQTIVGLQAHHAIGHHTRPALNPGTLLKRLQNAVCHVVERIAQKQETQLLGIRRQGRHGCCFQAGNHLFQTVLPGQIGGVGMAEGMRMGGHGGHGSWDLGPEERRGERERAGALAERATRASCSEGADPPSGGLPAVGVAVPGCSPAIPVNCPSWA